MQSISAGIKATILAGSVVLALAIGGMSAGLPSIEAALAHTPSDRFLTKMLVGVVGAAMVVGAPLTGFLANRFGMRRILFLNYLLFTLAGFAGLYLSDLRALVVMRFLMGVGAAGAATGSIVMINRLLPVTQRAQWLGLYIAVSFIASIGMHPLVGMLAQMNWHYMFALCLAGAPIAVTALISLPAQGVPSHFNRSSGTAVENSGRGSLFATPRLRWFSDVACTFH
jgi:MFS family permease